MPAEKVTAENLTAQEVKHALPGDAAGVTQLRKKQHAG
jgi:hypothetical protein